MIKLPRGNLFKHLSVALKTILMQKKPTTKQCITCTRVLPLSKFRQYKNKSGSIGYRHDCRSCEREKDRSRRQKQKDIKNKTIKKKQCTACKQVFPLSKFRKYRNRSGSLGYRRSCRECERKQNQERYQRQKTQSNNEKKIQKKSSVQDNAVLFANWIESNNVHAFDIDEVINGCNIPRGDAEKIIYKQICKGYLNQMGANNFVVNMGKNKRTKI